MRFHRACQRLKKGLGVKTFENGYENEIPESLHMEALSNPKNLFSQYHEKGCKWSALIEESVTSDSFHGGEGEREWKFRHEVDEECKPDTELAASMWDAMMLQPGLWRYHPDMLIEGQPKPKKALQVHWLAKDKSTWGGRESSQIRASKSRGGTVVGRKFVAGPPKPAIAAGASETNEEAAAASGAAAAGGEPAVAAAKKEAKQKNLTAEQLKEELLKQQQAERERRARTF